MSSETRLVLRLLIVIASVSISGYYRHERRMERERAAQEFVDAIEAARRANGMNDNRHHIAHIQVIHPDDIPRFRALGAIANAQPTWIDGIAAYCDHRVRFGVVESLNTTIKAVLRRARGMRDEVMLLLKLKWATARPIRSSSDLAKFVNFQLHSNR